MSTGSWDDLVTVALLGTARRRVDDVALPAPLAAAVPAAGPSGGPPDPAVRLLDVAALATVYLRAGMRSHRPPPRPAPSPPDPRPPVGPASRDRLAALVARNDGELLALWLTAATERGLRPPATALPALLDLAARDRALAPVVLAAAGPPGRWLAGHRRHWAALLATVPDRPAGPPSGEEDARAWRFGAPAERRAWLAAFRSADPATARELLERGWNREAPGERAALLAVLADGLSGADEPFLERCLDDRRGEVRSAAARLLAVLPGSGLGRRAADRARAAVRPERHLLRRRLAVTLPTGHDAAMARDQVPPPPGVRGGGVGGPLGPGAWLLLHVVAAAPLATWVPALGGTPAEVTALDVEDGWRGVLWLGWARAAARERDVAWASALLDGPPTATGGGADVRVTRSDLAAATTELLDLVPPAQRARFLAAVLADRAMAPLTAAAVLRPVPAPWLAPLPGEVLGWLHRCPSLETADAREVLDLAAHRLPIELVGAVRALADRWPEMSVGSRLAREAAEVMTMRHEMIEELQ